MKGAHKLLLKFHRPWSFLPLKMAAQYPAFCPLLVSRLVARDTDVNCIMSVKICSHFAYYNFAYMFHFAYICVSYGCDLEGLSRSKTDFDLL